MLLALFAACDTSTATPTALPTLAVSVDEILQMTPEEYETELRKAGRSDEHITQTLQDFEQNKADVLRWREQFEVHWPNVEAFGEVQHNFATDKTISKEEFEHICFVKQQWQDQLTGARDYVRDYREADPQTFNKNTEVLTNLETEAERGLHLLSKAECE